MQLPLRVALEGESYHKILSPRRQKMRKGEYKRTISFDAGGGLLYSGVNYT